MCACMHVCVYIYICCGIQILLQNIQPSKFESHNPGVRQDVASLEPAGTES